MDVFMRIYVGEEGRVVVVVVEGVSCLGEEVTGAAGLTELVSVDDRA